jgi:class 3 adenylate cyclase
VTFLETVAQARALLERNHRVSLRALAREFELEGDALDELVDELVDVQQVAAHPQAHEDDAERAVRAGLEILTALRTLNEALERDHGIRLAARVGIHTGPVVIGAMGGGAKSETLALGDTPPPAWRGSGSARASATPPAPCSLRSTPGSPKASTRAT